MRTPTKMCVVIYAYVSSPKLGVRGGFPIITDYSTLGSILGVPLFWETTICKIEDDKEPAKNSQSNLGSWALGCCSRNPKS